MNIAEWILVAFLSCALLVFLILAIVLTAKLIGIANETKKIVLKGQDIAEDTRGIVTNVKGMTSIGGVVQTFADRYIDKVRDEVKEKAKTAASKAKTATEAKVKSSESKDTK